MNSYSAPLVTQFSSRPIEEARASDSWAKGYMEMRQNTLTLLQEQFEDSPSFIPISVIGDNIDLKVSIISNFARLESMQLPCFQIGEDTLLSVYPRPIQVGNHHLLLFEMHETDFLDENKLKSLHAVLSVTSVCIVCMKSAQLFPSLNKIYQLYAAMWPKCGFKLSKIFACVETVSLALQGRKHVDQAQLGDLYDFFYVGKKVISERSFTYLLGKISEYTYSGDYSLADSKFHRNLASYYNPTPLPIYSLLRLIETLIQFGNLDLSLEQYLEQLPDFNQMNWLIDQKQAESEASQADLGTPVVPLITMSLEDSNRATISSEVLTILRDEFATCQDLIPIAVIGDFRCGKNAILDEFAALGGDFKAFSSFGHHYGVTVLPKPVQIGKYQYLFMKMSVNFRDEDEQKRVLFKKVAHAILSISAVCILCFEKDDVFSEVNEIMELYHGLLYLEVSKFFICLESESDLNNPGYRHLMESRDRRICECFYRGRLGISKECISSMLTTLTKDYLLCGYEATHWPLEYQQYSKIYLINSYLEMLLYFANLGLTLEEHILKAPVYCLPFWWEQIAPVEQHLRIIDGISQALPLFHRIEDSVEPELQVERLIPHVDLVTPAVPLITISLGDSSIATISSEVITMLREQSAMCPNLIPITVIGQSGCGKSLILDKFATLGEVNQSFSSFGECSGVIVLPTPVQIGKYQFLLMEMSVDFINEEDEEKVLLMKKVLFALMSITSVCIFCFEKESLFLQLDEIFDLYREMRKKCHVEVSKFFICVENESALHKPPLSTGYNTLAQGEFSEMCEFYYRGNDGIREDCFNSMLSKLTEDNFHRKYEESHRIWQHQGYSGVEFIISYIEVLVQLANMDITLERYIENAVVYDRPDWFGQINLVETQQRVMQEFAQTKALPLFTRIEGSIELDFESIEAIKRSFYLHEPIVILCIIGNQGLGKSTLLNHIIQHILHSRRTLEVFKVGNTQIHTTKNSQVSSQPLRLMPSNRQLMLIDLEGLGGIETTDEEEKIRQTNLTSDILVLSSVYCIILKNELNNLDFVKGMVGRISLFRTVFDFQVHRIYLLYHDKEEDSVGTNADLVTEVNRLNQVYFSGAEVVLIINKPSFVSAETAQMRQQFLEELINDIDHPKLKQDGTHLSVLELLEMMDFDLQKKRFSGECSLGRRGKEDADAIIDAKLQKMTKSNETAVKQITSVDSIENLRVICETETELRRQRKSEMYMQYVLKSLLIKQGRKQARPELRNAERTLQVKQAPARSRCVLY